MTERADPWAARLPANDAAGAAALRLHAGVVAAEAEGVLWIRGPSLTDDLDAALRRVPGIERFRIVEGDRLVATDARVPSERLPTATWRPIAKLLVPDVPTAALAGERPPLVRLRVVRSGAERAPAAVLTDMQTWESWCALAPDVRLRPLRFAGCTDGRVLVVGAPLPPIATATSLWIDAGVAVPCGYAPEPDLGGDALRILLSLADGDVGLLGADGSFELVPAAGFAAASRSAARLTRSGRAQR